MDDNEIRSARSLLLGERLATIRSKQRTLFDSLNAHQVLGSTYTQARIAEINQLEFEAKSIVIERMNLETLRSWA